MVLILICIIKITYSVNSVKSNYNINTTNITGIVTNIKKEEDKTLITIKEKENILVYYYNNIDLNLGDKINVQGTLEMLKDNTNFNLFNYRKYMLSKNTYYKMKCTNIKIVKKNNNIFYSIKNYLIKRINKIKRSDYLSLFILGDNSYLNDKIKNSYSLNGISHLFSRSGTP